MMSYETHQFLMEKLGDKYWQSEFAGFLEQDLIRMEAGPWIELHPSGKATVVVYGDEEKLRSMLAYVSQS